MNSVNLETVTFETVSQYAQSFGKAELLEQTRSLVSKERDLTARTLILFQEIEKRMIHLEMGYSSLFDMLVQHFGLSEGSASRRVASIRLMADIPEIDKKIKEGSLSLSNAAAAQRFFKAEEKNQNPLDSEMKKEVLASLAGKSTREAEKELIQRSSVPIELQTPDQIKIKGEEHVEIRFLAPQSLAGLLEEVRGLLAHRFPSCSMAELIQVLAEMGIEKMQKERFGVGCKPREQGEADAENICADVDSEAVPESPQDRSRHIPMPVRRGVFLRAKGKCEYVNEATGKRCNSTLFLELDHTKAFAKGGQHTLDSIVLACRSHNSLRAAQDFGFSFMEQFKKGHSENSNRSTKFG